MTPDEIKIRETLDRYCDVNGGGVRQIETISGRFGGYYVELVWDGFKSIGLGARHDDVAKALIDGLGSSAFMVVRKLHLVTAEEKAEEETVATSLQNEPTWLRA